MSVVKLAACIAGLLTLAVQTPLYGQTSQLWGKAGERWKPDGRLPEIVEWSDHPWFIGVQFHPELKSKPFAPHPLFEGFVKAAVENSRLV